MTFLVFVGVFIGLACLGVPLLTLALFAAITAEPDPLPEPHAPAPAPALSAGSRTDARRIDLSGTTV